ncbi:MAG: class II aldolase/adducin family protein [Alicyclobacillus sp.]|nr:class II aldolase/adducin family protein [Alicyclobacillus sp.]
MTTQALKQQLVEAIVMMEKARLLDFNGHMSARIPGTDKILINSRKSSRSALTEADIVTINLEGELLEGVDEPPSEYHIHTEIYRRRPDVGAIAHTHPQWSTLFSITQIPLRPVIIQGAVLGKVNVFQKPNLINTRELGVELAEALADHRAILMKAHGAVVAGEGIMETFVLSVYLEENAYRQYMASQLGYAHSLTDAEIAEMGRSVWQPKITKKVWDYHRAKFI